MSVKDGPGEGTWSVFAQKVVEQRDKAIEERNDVFRRLREVERRCVSLERERDEALRLLTTRVEAKRLDEAQEEIARLCAEARRVDAVEQDLNHLRRVTEGLEQRVADLDEVLRVEVAALRGP
jgi:uncharacterized protein YydD (DUF2326 family)